MDPLSLTEGLGSMCISATVRGNQADSAPESTMNT